MTVDLPGGQPTQPQHNVYVRIGPDLPDLNTRSMTGAGGRTVNLDMVGDVVVGVEVIDAVSVEVNGVRMSLVPVGGQPQPDLLHEQIYAALAECGLIAPTGQVPYWSERLGCIAWQPANEYALALAGTTLEQPEPQPRPDTPTDLDAKVTLAELTLGYPLFDAAQAAYEAWAAREPEELDNWEDYVAEVGEDQATVWFTVVRAVAEIVRGAGVRGEPHTTPTQPENVDEYGCATWTGIAGAAIADPLNVRVYIPGKSLDPESARRYAQNLLAAADWAEGGGQRG